MGWLASSLTSLSFGTTSSQASSSSNTLAFDGGQTITTIGASAFAGTQFTTIDLTALENLQSVGSDAFSDIVGLEKVTLSQDQAQVVNPAVFSGVGGGDPSKPTNLSIELKQNGGGSSLTLSSLGPTLTPASNLNRFTSVTEMDLSAAPISSLQGGVLWGNPTLQTLVLPATATNWKVTEPKSYESAPIGWKEGQSQGSQSLKNLEWSGFTLAEGNQQGFAALNETTWSQVASILNMFGRVEEDNGKDKNLLAWSEGFKGPELDAESVKRGWATKAEDAKDPNKSNQQIESGTSGEKYKLVNGLTWTYSKSGQNQITLTVENSSKPNLYRAGYTNNPYAFYQVGFGAD